MSKYYNKLPPTIHGARKRVKTAIVMLREQKRPSRTVLLQILEGAYKRLEPFEIAEQAAKGNT